MEFAMSEGSSRSHRTLRRRLAQAVLVILVALAHSGRASAQQDVAQLAASCAGGDAGLQSVCLEGALAAQAAHAGVGLLAAGGAQVPGAASTLGRRFGGTPRFSVSLRGNAVLADLADIRDGGASDGRSFFGIGTQGSLALGLLDGFSLLPTIGGVLSLDAFATAGVLGLPGGRGLDPNPFTWGFGANLGLLRESFTLPGVTVSAARRGIGEVRLGERAAGDAVETRVDPSVTSLRGVVGKDLLAVGVLAGVGWDRYESDGTLAVSGPQGVAGQANLDGLRSDRILYFGGASLNLLLLQFSIEGGWAGGLDGPERPAGRYDPGSGTPFFALAGRLTL
jgi:hypothetical protein